MVRRNRFTWLVSAALLLPTLPSRADGVLATAPIDYSLYREGEVQRKETAFSRWLLTCDEIRRLKQKFCSLRSVARAPDGTIVAAMTISTDDRGRPAALVTVPFGTSLTRGVSVVTANAAAPRRGGKIQGVLLRPTQCGGDLGCQAIWPMTQDDVRSLRAGQPVRLSFSMTRTPPTPGDASMTRDLSAVTGTVDADGFVAALQASLK